MLNNNRDDNDSEYHFTDSDEEANYEVDTESTKPEAPTKPVEARQSSRPGQPRRVLISIGVFVLLVFVVYKMISSSSNPPSTVITPPVATAAPKQNEAVRKPVSVAAMPSQPAATVNSVMNSPPPPPVNTAQANNAPVMTTTTPPVNTAMPPAVNSITAPTTPANSMGPPVAQMQTPQTQSMPAVIPVQSTAPTYNVNQPGMINTIPSSATIDAKAAAMAGDNEKMMNQMQADYTQKINDFSAQNKVMQDQIQALNTRVAGMERQLTELMQSLTRQEHSNNDATSNEGPSEAPPVRYQGGEKSSYNVQAIIPGRAWLRSESGETVTVAEGDTIKSLGRVTKIDPYDGVVEINTGSKVISLSYGNGG